MSMTYCKNCDANFDTDATEQADLCGYCERHAPVEYVPTTIDLMHGDDAMIEMDCTLVLRWIDEGWEFAGAIATPLTGPGREAKPAIQFDKQGTVKIAGGWKQHSAFGPYFTMMAQHAFELHRIEIIADLPDHSEPELIPYTDDAYRRIAMAH